MEAMDVDSEVPINPVNISTEDLNSYYQQVEQLPSPKSPIDGKIARLAYEFMEDTALRVNELIHVRKRDIDRRTRILLVTMPKVSQKCKCARWKNKNDYSRVKVLASADPLCPDCHGEGRYKKPQRTTITPRIWNRVIDYISNLNDDDILFPISRKTLWKWAKTAGQNAGLNVFIVKKDKTINNMFNHFFRALCTVRMKRDATNEQFRDELIMAKRRDTYESHVERYTEIGISELLAWEDKTYQLQ